MQRFFVEPYQVQEEEHRITLTGPDLNHMKNVLRMRIGEDVWISDGSEKEYHCTIEEFQEDIIQILIKELITFVIFFMVGLNLKFHFVIGSSSHVPNVIGGNTNLP